MTISEAVKILRDNNNFLILTHIRPDGDTIGSASALCYALRKIGKTAYLYNNPQFGDSYPWIVEPYIEAEGFVPAFTVSIDMADPNLFPQGFEGHVDLCFDHHPSNTFYAKNTLLWADKASCGEVAMEVIKELCGLDAAVADLLYVAVSTDTGCFVYGNTTGDTLRAASELCYAGARNAFLNKILFRTSSKARLALEALIFSSLRYYHDGKTVIAIVTKDMLDKAGASEIDSQDIAALPGRAEGAFTSVTIKEIDENSCKVSLRSNGIVDANKVCANFGGGGHKMASGCSINKGCEEAAELLADIIAAEYK